MWTWVSGSDVVNQVGAYTGLPLVPGARHNAAAWTDASNYLWLFGGGSSYGDDGRSLIPLIRK